MTPLMEQTIWWTGFVVLSSVGVVGAAALVFFAYLAAWLAANHYARRFGNVASNMQAMFAWKRSGSPEWKLCDDKVYRRVPTVGSWSEKVVADEEAPE